MAASASTQKSAEPLLLYRLQWPLLLHSKLYAVTAYIGQIQQHSWGGGRSNGKEKAVD